MAREQGTKNGWTDVLLQSFLTGATIVSASTGWYLWYYHHQKKLRAEWQQEEEQTYGHDTLPSIIEHFREDLVGLSISSTIQEANERRTASYYLKARDSHLQSLVLGVQNFSQLVTKRCEEVDRLLHYYNRGTQSHRTVIVMCDGATQNILEDARHEILEPLQYSTDVTTRGVWIPELNIIPPEDMHVTVAIPWWWHTMRKGEDDNEELSQALANRLRQALVLEMHHPFQLELERIILLGGKTLVALWRTVGERPSEDGTLICDRHGTGIDPMVRLRREIVRCFTTDKEEIGRKPLTYLAHKQSNSQETPATPTEPDSSTVAIPRPAQIQDRQHTIEAKTPGLGQGDGFIHTTLCRLALDCLSPHDVELDPIHRLCREATAKYCGHRMVVSKFRVVETTGKGGESNPCIAPIFDETIQAPTRVVVDAKRGQYVMPNSDPPMPERHATLGALPDLGPEDMVGEESVPSSNEM